MGFIYDFDNRLVCEICGQSGGVRKHKCPFGYCPPVAAHPQCKKGRKGFTKAFHREMGCEVRMEIARRADESERVLREQGYYTRISALNGDNGVHVLFSDGKRTIGYYMSRETYRAFDLGTIATPEDFQRHGELTPAPTTFDFGRTTKQVVSV